MNTAQEPPLTTTSEHPPLQQNAQGILVGAPPPLSARGNLNQSAPIGMISHDYLLALGTAQLLSALIFAFIGLPLMKMSLLTLNTVGNQLTPFHITFLNALIALIALGVGVAGMKYAGVRAHWLYVKGIWPLFGVGIVALFVFIVYILWLLLFP